MEAGDVESRGGARELFAAVLLAIVIGATALSFWVATKNFETANPKRSPRTAEVLAMANVEGDESREMFARYFASESNRAMFAFMAPLQVVGCAGAFLLAFRRARGRRGGRALRRLLGAGFVLSVALAPFVPMMIAKGRAIDFVSRAGGDPPEVASFKIVHAIYSAGDLLLLLAAIGSVFLLGRSFRAERSGDGCELRSPAR